MRKARLDNKGLYEMVCNSSNLRLAWEKVRDNKGCAGSDRVTIEDFEQDLDANLGGLENRLRLCDYRPLPLRQVIILKKDGSKRKLAIPAVVDRVAQQAVLNIIGRLIDQEFEDCSFAYRKGRSIYHAIARIERYRSDGYTWVLDADIDDYFDEVDHELVLNAFGKYIKDRRIANLIRMWLECGVQDGFVVKRREKGLPQGSPVSPLLSNLYLDVFDEALSTKGYKLIRYSDDFIILCRERPQADRALQDVEALLRELRLALNVDKTRITNFTTGFRYLGALFVGSMVLAPRPGKKVEKTAIDEQLCTPIVYDAAIGAEMETAPGFLITNEHNGPSNQLARRSTTANRQRGTGYHGRSSSFYPFADAHIEISALADYVFCRNAFYYRHVLGFVYENQDMLAGRVLHETVHSDSTTNRGGKVVLTNRPLFSRRLGITGRADVLEQKDGGLLPVEYKTGQRSTLWPSIRVQLCAQALALEDMTARPVPHGYVYFTESRSREKVSFDHKLRCYTIRIISEARELQRRTTHDTIMPSTKCFRCSTRHMCLPEETVRLKRFAREGVFKHIIK
ncbi:MAG: CRISPR-associated protein Cas4 [Candidatus Aquicultor secundus]|uniref:CRISPR-associated protein Cas4 n=1 Tax=Candidatus Aquicultor secundus TaxID=1973895 RepID=A0A2M7T6K2_9ACTN|nr:CRISPR-associated protein Cas4 [Candidatus Aquicultor secundus]OIO88994.1 MAG: CRISPR-associated protein Cas4 [Candidatus Aquicultor secundus]PIU27667.1 MAG: CRISPR-associated protein Cas4 [Candidatus Aquicultor secundus]PIW22477.1 MAG: CRISPR-associated protein Cas4 [Candidatus Aquicultor secundus]PIX52701.1 MAG: CRISPR-associated protein Cas4 [Candidatus Aquicultor secundus]PIY37630.1 MAG: CRISPR-associated protein Cas4 [Candidatus Aquicultor secundus]